ncbi:hypothetical protein N9K15_03585 [Maribacter arcticus]|nr:hypothetical protein [Maribacter arcticus]MDA9090007.1 hypothetical protein [Maribacter arcticus]
MHLLLKRQLNKYLSSDLEKHPDMPSFLEVIYKSYENHDEKLSMLHRASMISSDELYDANRKLHKEALQQKNILVSLENAIRSLTENLNEEELFGQNLKDEFNAEHLATYISNLATKVSDMTLEKDKLLKSLENQNQSLNNYAQIVSHDLKSPILFFNFIIS